MTTRGDSLSCEPASEFACNSVVWCVCRIGFISEMTLGAVVSTGYHGSGLAFGALEDYVRQRHSYENLCSPQNGIHRQWRRQLLGTWARAFENFFAIR